MIGAAVGRVLWWALCRWHGAGVNVTAEMLDGIDAAISEQGAAVRGERA